MRAFENKCKRAESTGEGQELTQHSVQGPESDVFGVMRLGTPFEGIYDFCAPHHTSLTSGRRSTHVLGVEVVESKRVRPLLLSVPDNTVLRLGWMCRMQGDRDSD